MTGSFDSLEIEERDYCLSVKEGWARRVNTPGRIRPPDMTRADLDGLAGRDRLRYNEARKVWHANLGPILTSQMAEATERIADIVDANRQDGDKVKSAAVLDAWPGLGKTTLAVAFGASYHQAQMDLHGPLSPSGDERIPVVYVGLTSNTTMRSLNAMLCRFYGHPGAVRGNAQQLADRASDCVLACATRLIIIDDVHFLDMARRDSREVANHFKWLANQFPVTFLYVGVGIAERGLLSEGLHKSEIAFSQTARRWTRLGLDPFEVRTEPGRKTWRSLLLNIERDLVLAEKTPGMVANELAEYLYTRSTGHFASLMCIIARGCQRAIKTGTEYLDTKLLDTVRNDEAAERSRLEIQAAFDNGLLRGTGRRGAA
jgi:hypothetical protein